MSRAGRDLSRYLPRSWAQRPAGTVVGVLVTVLGGLRTEGLENLPRTGPAIVAAPVSCSAYVFVEALTVSPAVLVSDFAVKSAKLPPLPDPPTVVRVGLPNAEPMTRSEVVVGEAVQLDRVPQSPLPPCQ